MSDETHNVPDSVNAAWRALCSCCPDCSQFPCCGVMAGGMCDHARCACEDEYPDDCEDGDDFSECGQLDDGTCMLAGTEHCDWDCPYSD